MYAPVFDPRTKKSNRYTPSILSVGKGWVEYPSDGEYEGGILCHECDNKKIGNELEDYGAKAIYAPLGQNEESPEWCNFTNGSFCYTHGRRLDYKRFKLMLLSILWRASISKRPFFSQISLGPYEEHIRQMIINQDPGGAFDYPVLIATWLNDASQCHSELYQPTINRKEGGIRYIFPIAGTVYIFHIHAYSLRKELDDFVLLPSNEVKVLHLPKGKASGWLADYCRNANVQIYSATNPRKRDL